ncbi:TPR repeat-containing protein [Alkaliphilus metalliredigens QYMF]|uniref:TPR repeat-containing protein n=1 Tax=Alkaliphilus metalliredigens (strain QYMF) TaxID=293826 RepID=A6TK13_ALKMQ|nr:hypothetical protein [Alkaliphilus metalliredigens]ABR46531.1 TPR repeat-containing protein [Alkaliphilus metalliredigens QYMF]
MNWKIKTAMILTLAMVLMLSGCSLGEKEDPSVAKANANYKNALQLIKADQLAEAKGILEESIELNATEGIYHIALGNIYLREDEKETALSNFVRSIEKTPKYREAYNNAVGLYMLNNQYEQALTTVQEGLAIAPEDLELTFKKAQIYFIQDKNEEAIEGFQFLIEADSETYFEAYRFLGLSQLNLDLKEEAKMNLEKYIEVAPEAVPVRESIENILSTLK